jgi:hypothetical protein
MVLRKYYPDEETMEDMKKALRDNGIDFKQLEKWNPKTCRWVYRRG